MAVGIKVELKMDISASPTKVWDALVNPEIIKQYLFGTNTITDWKIGSPIVFQGVWDGTEYKDKGTILEFIPEKKLKYDYWSSFSPLEDKPENYQQITFTIEVGGDTTVLALIQENITDETTRGHSENNWKMILNQIKQIVERNAGK
ncbi:MAG: SRPBCC domain-containing protein [Melioribacteraceae bacterium]|nr:SRPBCC domain-containing protein [Melioribacteraceae bacterium]